MFKTFPANVDRAFRMHRALHESMQRANTLDAHKQSLLCDSLAKAYERANELYRSLDRSLFDVNSPFANA